MDLAKILAKNIAAVVKKGLLGATVKPKSTNVIVHHASTVEVVSTFWEVIHVSALQDSKDLIVN